MELEDIATTWGDVREGDVMFRGTVKRVSAPIRSRAGRMLMTVEYEDGTKLVKDPDTACNLKRPAE